MGKFLAPSLLLAALAAAQAPRELDAGTWIRQSFTVAPGAVGPCPSEDVFLERAKRVYKVHLLPPLVRDEAMRKARNRARGTAAACEELRQSLARSVKGEWSGILSMERFDANPLPRERLERVASAYGANGGAGLEAVLGQELSDTLRTLLARTALSRSGHLRSDFQRNSLVNDKLKTEDLTESELALVRNSAHVLVLRAISPDIDLSEKKGWRGSAVLESEMWSFDPVAKRFSRSLSDRSAVSEEGSPEAIGAHIGASAANVRNRILELQAFKFTSQTVSLAGNWLLPASVFQSNTKADMQIHRRFLYTETQVQKNGNESKETIGYGYVDRIGKDSTVRIRHIGGQSPYVGMTLQEIPGTWWSTLGYSWTQAQWRHETPSPDESGERLQLRHLSPSPTLRLQIRGNAPGNGLFQYFGLDIAGSAGNATGGLEHIQVSSDGKWEGVNNLPLSSMWTMDLSLNYGVRIPLRRLSLLAGVQAGIRPSWLFFGTEEQQVRLLDTSFHGSTRRPDPYWDDHDITSARSVDAWLGLTAGAQISLNATHGLGVEARWEPLRGRSDWEVNEGSASDGNSFSVPTNEGGLGRFQLVFQWVFR